MKSLFNTYLKHSQNIPKTQVQIPIKREVLEEE
jgi:hypothetical protein